MFVLTNCWTILIDSVILTQKINFLELMMGNKWFYRRNLYNIITESFILHFK